MFRPLHVACVALVAAACLTSGRVAEAWEERRTVIADFEAADWASKWVPVQKIEASRVPVPPDEAPAEIKEGHALHIVTAGGAGVATKKGVRPEGLADYDAVEFGAWRSPAKGGAAAKPSVMEVQFLEGDGTTKFWRKIELTHTGWKKIRVELPYFRNGDGRLPRWPKIERVLLWFRDKADVVVDDLAVVKTDQGGASLQPDDLTRLAFPDAAPGAVNTLVRDGVVVVTDRPQADAEAILSKLVAVQKRVVADLPFVDEPAFPIPLIVFSKEADYRAFAPRLAAAFGGEALPPTAAGLTVLGVASSFWSDEFKADRPVYGHEFVHALLSSRYDIGNHNEWLQEGLASYYQLQFFKQADFPKIVTNELNAGNAEPFEKLTSGERIALTTYWEAATLCDLLLTSPKYREKFPKLMSEFRNSGATNLPLVCEKTLGVDLKTLYGDWKDFCREKYSP